MSLATETRTIQQPYSTYTINSDGDVHTETLASTAISLVIGIATVTTVTGSNAVEIPITISGSPVVTESWAATTKTITGSCLPRRALNIVTTHVVSTTRITVIGIPSTVLTANLTGVVSTLTSRSTGTTAVIITVTPSSPLSLSSSQSTATTDPSLKLSRSAPTASTFGTLTTLTTVTTTATPSLRPTAAPIPAVPPSNHLSSLWWVSFPAILGALIIIALVFLWRRCGRKSFDDVCCIIHAVFETIGCIVFGKNWDKWKATRKRNRRKKSESSNRLSKFDDSHIRNYFLNRWNETAEGHKNHCTMARHSSPLSTAPNRETWRNIGMDTDTIVGSPRPEAMKMRNTLSHRSRPAEHADINQNLTEDRNSMGKGKEASLRASRSSEALPCELNAGVHQKGPTSSISVPNEEQLRTNTTQYVPYPGTPWAPESDDTSSHNQWFPQERSTPDLRNQIQKDIEEKRQAILAEIEVQSNTSFRGARGAWPVNHPQPLIPSVKTVPLAATVNLPSGRSWPAPVLLANHPILRLPSPKPLPGERQRRFSKLHVPPLDLRKKSAGQWTDKTRRDTAHGFHSNQSTLWKPDKGKIASFLGWNSHNSNNADVEKGAAATPKEAIRFPSPDKTPVPDRLSALEAPTRRTSLSLSQWTDATVPDTPPPVPLRADHSHRWTSLRAGKSLGSGSQPSSISSVSSWEASSAGGAPVLSPKKAPHRRDIAMRVPNFNTDANSVTSVYSGYWEDDRGGGIHYDHTSRIRDVEFQDHAKALLDQTPRASASARRPLTRDASEGYVDVRRSRIQADLNSNGYQRDGRGNWI